MEIKGKLLVSTKASPGRWIACVILGAIYLLIVVFLIWAESALGVFKELFDSNVGSIILYIVALWLIVFVVSSLSKLRSHCEVYENGIKGITRFKWTKPMAKFDVEYKDIVNITESANGTVKIIQIQTQYASYEFMAYSNKDEAVRIIKEKIELTKQG